MDSIWNSVEISKSYGIVNYNLDKEYYKNVKFAISINLGECVKILGESQFWFYIKKFEDAESEEGIVPKSYIQIQECSITKQGDLEIVTPKLCPLVEEIDPAVKEWHRIAKKLYMEMRHDDFKNIQKNILQLHDCRKNILSPDLPAESIRDIKKQVAEIIDNGNHYLGLDMVVRDENGNLLNTSITSTVELFRKHHSAAQSLKKNEIGIQRQSRNTTNNSHCLLVTLTSIKYIKVVDECELRFFLYDASHPTEEGAFTECGQCFLKGNTSTNLGKNPIKFIFTDLGKADLERSKIYLVIYVIRIGAMEYKEFEPNKKDLTPFSQRREYSFANQRVKRPWAVAAKDISHIFKESNNTNKDYEEMLSYLPFGDQDTLDTLLIKLIKDGKENKTQPGFFCILSLIPGNLSQIQKDQPILFRSNLIVTRKMGFPEIILPNDIRNDLYVKLVKGEFYRGNKTSDRNIEVCITVHNNKGEQLKGIIYGGGGCTGQNDYKSVVYYHDDKPKWNEIFKIDLPMQIEEFSNAHIKFTFKHRSSSETKDRSEKPFALSFLKFRENDGTAIANRVHELVVYKIDSKHYKEDNNLYLSLPSLKSDLNGSKIQCPGYSIVARDFFTINTTLCSTKYTQNAKLLELLQWKTVLQKNIKDSNSDTNEQIREIILPALYQVLIKVNQVDGGEIVKFLTDVFDALFSIDPQELIFTNFSINSDNSINIEDELVSKNCDRPVFDCLLYIFKLILLDHKYQNFQSVVTVYIDECFSASLAFKKLLRELQYAFENPKSEKILDIMKCIHYFFKFIIRSYKIRVKFREMELGRHYDRREDEKDFQKSIELFFDSMNKFLIKKDTRYFIAAQGACLKFIPTIIEPLCRCKIFPERRLSELLFNLIIGIPEGEFVAQKLDTIIEIVHSPLFLDSICRTYLMTLIVKNIREHLPGNEGDFRRKSVELANKKRDKIKRMMGVCNEINDIIDNGKQQDPDEGEKCIKLLGDMMHILFRRDIGSTNTDISYIIQILLKPIILSIGTLGNNISMASKMVAILLDLFRQMTQYHYGVLINHLKGDAQNNQIDYHNKLQLREFLNNVLVVMKNLFSKSYFPNNWAEMILLQNYILLSALENFSKIISNEFGDPFEEQPWNNFFQCTVSFLIQESLQLEDFSTHKKNSILSRYGDMRMKASELIRSMWFSLGQSKRIRFVPSMVGAFLDWALVPEPNIRRTTIPIFFDMMHCELDQQEKSQNSFIKVEDELIRKLVEMAEGGKGDVEFRDIFSNTMTDMCENGNNEMKTYGLQMVRTVTKLLNLLLEYREIMYEDAPGNKMTCIVNLLDFSKEISKKDLYLRYLYKLHDLHIENENFTEAAFALKLHSRQLDWNDEDIPYYLKSNIHYHITTQAELKEALYYNTIDYFDKAKLWECALDVCEELRQQYTEEINYSALPKLHRKMADFYEKIINPRSSNEFRFEPGYYRVGFFGRGFPSFLQNKVFIYRGKESEQLSDFKFRMQQAFQNAEDLRSLDPPSEEIQSSNRQFLQINAVTPNLDSYKRNSGISLIEDSVKSHYRSVDIEEFIYTRNIKKKDEKYEHECLSAWLYRHYLRTSQTFPGILSWSPVVKEYVKEISPIGFAIEEIEKTNEALKKLIVLHCAKSDENLGPLSLKLNGTLDASVNGGLDIYEKAYLSGTYIINHPEDSEKVEKLKSLIIAQVPILDQALIIHEKKICEELRPMQSKLDEMFIKFKSHIENTYGVNASTLKDESLVKVMKWAIKRSKPETVKFAPIHSGSTGKNFDFSLGSKQISRFAKTMGNSSSTLNLNTQAKNQSGKSFSRGQQFFRRSTNLSTDSDLWTNSTMGGGTLPKNGSWSSNRLPSISGSTEAELFNGRPTSQPQHISQSMSKKQKLNERKSECWSTNSNSAERNSGISLGNLSDLSNRNSIILCNSPDSAIEEDENGPPALPQKQNKQSSRPPTPPPKKPPLNR